MLVEYHVFEFVGPLIKQGFGIICDALCIVKRKPERVSSPGIECLPVTVLDNGFTWLRLLVFR